MDRSNNQVINITLRANNYLRYIKKWGIPFNKQIVEMVLTGTELTVYLETFDIVLKEVKSRFMRDNSIP